MKRADLSDMDASTMETHIRWLEDEYEKLEKEIERLRKIEADFDACQGHCPY